MTRTHYFSTSVVLALLVLQGCKSPQGPAIETATFGQMPDGREVKIFTLTNSHGYKARITDYGAKLVSLEVPDKDGQLANVILGYDSLSSYLTGDQYFGATVGRYANRIAKGKFTLNGKDYQLALNNGPNHLHGGPGGYQSVLWNAEVLQQDGFPILKFTYQSPDAEEGYPGKLQIEVSYLWDDSNSLVITYKAVGDQDTYVNLTHHSLFNLKGAGNGDMLEHELMLAADAFTPVDSTLIPTGEIRPVVNTPFDFTAATAIGKRINDADEQLKVGNGYDHNWVLTKKKEFDLAAALYEPHSGRLMEVFTTEPGIQFYSGNFLDGLQIGSGNKPYNFRYGLALETQHFPDSPNQPSFPSTLLKKGEEYHQKTVYRFSTR
jgi:aldose 1-epimerase